MSNISLPRDNNRITVIGGTSSSDGSTPVTIYVDPVTHRLKVDSAASGSGITIGTTTITSGTDKRILYDNAGVVGEYTLSGSGTVVAMATSPVLTTATITTSLVPTTDDGAPLGDTTHNFSDLFLASGAVLNYANSNVVLTHTSGVLTLGTGTLKITTPTNTTTSVVTIDGTQTLTNKSITGGQITSAVSTATALASARTLWGQNFDGTGNVTGSLTAVADITGGASSMTITAGTGASRTLIFKTTTSGSTATTALTLAADQSATFANTVTATTFVGALTGTASGNLVSGGALGTPSSGVGTNITGITATHILAGTLGTGAYTMDTQLTVPQVITTANAIAASSNAATVPVTSKNNIVTNNSAATLTITLTTTSAVNMQQVVVQILDFSAVAQTITWVNTENSTVSAPTTSNGSTSLPLTVGFIYNSATSKWRCVASS